MRAMNKVLFTALSILSLSQFACSGEDGKDGAAGPPGPQGGAGGEIGVSAVLPAAGFAGRSQTLTILGNGTKWTAESVPSFGDGVTVNSVRAVSPSALVVDVSYAATATIGERDVVVDTAGTKNTLAKALMLKLPVEVASVQGTQAQGSVLFVNLKNNDARENPFDTTADSGLFGSGDFTNFAANSKAGIGLAVQNVTTNAAVLNAFVDADFAAGKADLTIESGAEGATTDSFVPNAFDIVARTPKVLTAGTAFPFTPTAAFGSEFVKFTAADTGIAHWTVEGPAGAQGVQPVAMLLGANGKFSSALAQVGATTPADLVQDKDAVVHAVFFDAQGSTAALNLKSAFTPFASSSAQETEPNDLTTSSEIVGALPYMMSSATLGTLTDVDTYKITLAAPANLSLLTLAKDSTANPLDTLITIYAADGTTVIKTSDDRAYYDTLTHSFGAGIFYVKVSYSTEVNAATPATAYRFVVNPVVP